MKLHNFKKAYTYKVHEWLFSSIPELTKYQKERIINDEIVRFAPFEFMEKRKRIKSFWWRLTIIFIPVIWILLVAGLPINFIIKGYWGYSKLKWFNEWMNRVGL